jgi:hypothetical protein
MFSLDYSKKLMAICSRTYNKNMVPISEVPFNSIVWLMGSLACFMLCYRSFANYRVSKNELSKYLACFGLLMGIGQAFLAVPAFFTLDTETLRTAYLTGEFFIYGSAVAQAAILWCLILRSKVSIYAFTVPIALIGFAAWAYAVPRSTLHLVSNNFIQYKDPLFSTIVIGVVLITLFVPVGIYFLRSAAEQTHIKPILTSLSLGVVYIGIGFFTGGIELLTGQVITPRSAIFDLAFFIVMFSVLLWPHRAVAKVPLTR